jgi:internalin A
MTETLVPNRWWRRPRVRLSVRALMIIVLVLGCGFGWVVRRAHIQRDAVAAIVKGGGRVWYDWEDPLQRVGPDGEYRASYPSRTKRAPPAPKWLFDRLGPDYFGRVRQVTVGARDPDAVMARVAQLEDVRSVYFVLDVPLSDAGMKSIPLMTELRTFDTPIRGGKLTGASLENFKGLKELRVLFLTSKPVLADADLVHIKGLTALQFLALSISPENAITDTGVANFKDMVDMRNLGMAGARVTSAGLEYLRGMTKLHELRIPGTRVDDLAPIRHLTGLKFLHLGETPITDAGLAPIAGFSSLNTLFLRKTPITDAGVKHLRGLASLTQLDLGQTGITDAGLAELAGLKSLVRLDLSGTQVKEAGLAHLAGLSSLMTLNLSETGVTDAGLVYLTRLPLLTTLDLGKTPVTDAGLKHLAGMKSLNRLTIEGSATTDAAVNSLQNSMPQLRIARPPRPAAPPRKAS